MKNLFLSLIGCMALTLIMNTVSAQEDKSNRPSPPAGVTAMIGDAKVSIDYSAPSVKGRQIWGDLVPYGKIWRTGANEATIFETDEPIAINGLKLPAGKYSLFTIPGEKEWIFIFNSEWNQWGAYKYDASKDVLRVNATPKPADKFYEQMKFDIVGNKVVLHWENVSVDLEVN